MTDRYRTGIVVVAPSPLWAKQYRAVVEELVTALAHVPIDAIEHVGSTSVPGPPAKPILKILQEILALSNLTTEEKQTILELNTRTNS